MNLVKRGISRYFLFSILTLGVSIVFLLTGCSQSPSASATLEKENDGKREIVQLIEVEAWMKDKAIEVTSLLEKQEYISMATVSYLSSPSDESKIYFAVSLDGDNLNDHVDDILTMVTQDLDNIDLKNSYIFDIINEIQIYPELA